MWRVGYIDVFGNMAIGWNDMCKGPEAGLCPERSRTRKANVRELGEQSRDKQRIRSRWGSSLEGLKSCGRDFSVYPRAGSAL
jgi:hypothetical protein